MRPHPQHLDDAFIWEHLADKAVLDVDAPRVRAGEVADELLEGRRRAKRVIGEEI